MGINAESTSGRRGQLAAEPAATEAWIDSLTPTGLGRGRDGDHEVDVHGALPGERVSYRRATRSRRGGRAYLTERVLTASSHRLEPRCRYFGTCGGCALQHLDSSEQIRHKQEWLLAALREHGGIAPSQVLPSVCGPIWSYRTKTRLGVKLVLRKERVLVGFRERFAPFITDMNSCEILDQRIAALIEPLTELIAGLSIRRRLPQIEAAAGDQHLVLVMRTLDPPTSADLDQLRRFVTIHQVGIRLQPKGPDSIYELDAGEGPGDLEYQHPDHRVTLRFAPQHFTQINAVVNRKMVSLALRLLAVDRHDRVLDLFCGIGNFSLPLARYAGEVVAVEGDVGLVEMARQNATANGIHNASFCQADLQRCSFSETWAMGDFTAAVVDPPRSGAAAVMDVVPNLGVARLVYVSCHADTLARDANVLVKRHGYRLTSAGVLDMFPHTTHFESIALFERT